MRIDFDSVLRSFRFGCKDITNLGCVRRNKCWIWRVSH